MGGASSSPLKEKRLIPQSKRYDVVYLTGLLTAPLAEKQSSKSSKRNDHIRMAIAACDALQNVSDSYAYSEEAIAAGCLPALVGLTRQQTSQQEASSTTGTGERRNCHDNTCNCSQKLELALACAHTLLYMVDESSAPALFCKALLPLLQGGQESLTATSCSGSSGGNQDDWCCNVDAEGLRVCLDKIGVLVLRSALK